MTGSLNVHAISATQGGFQVYAFFLPGAQILEIADMARIGKDSSGTIFGFQRPEIVAHVKHIADYLQRRDVLFPNAIILALAPGVKFAAKRGSKNRTAEQGSEGGILSIPRHRGRKAAWIVDGQQRALALGESGASKLAVPVIAFVSGDLAVHREQFILVNKARPLDRRLIDELLPSVGAILPRDLAARRVPSALCTALNDTPGSPFHRLIRRPSDQSDKAIVLDSHLVRVARRSMGDPRGALAAFVSPDGRADMDGMYRVMADYWSAVRHAFPDAWGLPPERSRLMHGAGIAAMGVLMDQIMTRDIGPDAPAAAREILSRLAPHCHWTAGRWTALDRDWNDLQCTTRDIRALSNLLISLEREVSRQEAA